ncbi:MAG: hypothetical protein PHI97_24500 [Desulfobulbus sp.]|nr:hypothetical protein [Desulfobulbus sp.]
MPESYGWETIEAAEELYILDGLTFEQVAERTGVSVTQLKRWSADSTPSWPDRRREYRQAQVSVRRGVMLAKAKLIESVINEEDPQKAYAFSSLVGSGQVIEQEARQRSGVAERPATNEMAPPADPANMIDGLKLALQQKIATLIQQPGALTLAAIKELQQAMAMLEQLNKQGQGEPSQAMTPEQLQAEIKRVYGI